MIISPITYLISFIQSCLQGLFGILSNTTVQIAFYSVTLGNLFIAGVTLGCIIGVLTVIMRK